MICSCRTRRGSCCLFLQRYPAGCRLSSCRLCDTTTPTHLHVFRSNLAWMVELLKSVLGKENTVLLLLLLLRSPSSHSRRERKYANIPLATYTRQVVMNTRAMYVCADAASNLPPASPISYRLHSGAAAVSHLIALLPAQLKAVRHSHNAHTSIIYRKPARRRSYSGFFFFLTTQLLRILQSCKGQLQLLLLFLLSHEIKM